MQGMVEETLIDQVKRQDSSEILCLTCRYRAALDAALATEQVEIVANLLEELAARSGLGAALGRGCSVISHTSAPYMYWPAYAD